MSQSDVPSLRLDGETIWVTGTAQGIGSAVADLLLKLGARVVGFDKQTQTGKAGLLPCEVDLADPARVASCIRDWQVAAPPTGLVSAAGVLYYHDLPDLEPAHWRKTFQINVDAPFCFLHHLSAHFIAQRRGNIVLIGSNAAHVPRQGMAAYGASKAALRQLAMTTALEWAQYGLRCNVVSPGSTDTAMQRALWADASGEASTIAGDLQRHKLGIPLGRLATPDDIARSVAFLLSDWSRHITMQDLVVDSGATLGA